MMLIPTFSLIIRDETHLWRRIRDFLERRLPPQKQIFLTMLTGRDWMAYRKELVRDLPHRPGNDTTIHDVPLFYRAALDIPAMRYSAYILERSEDPRKWRWILKRKQRAIQDAKIAAAKLEFNFDTEFMKRYGEEEKKKKKKKKRSSDST